MKYQHYDTRINFLRESFLFVGIVIHKNMFPHVSDVIVFDILRKLLHPLTYFLMSGLGDRRRER